MISLLAPPIFSSLLGFILSRLQACFAAGRSGDALREHMKRGYEAARPSGWDPVERLKDQDLDGVVAEVLYSSPASSCST
jgi:hypothetical protein